MTPDGSVLAAEVVFPGHRRTLEVEPPERAPMALYFLFATPDGGWKILIDPPPLKQVQVRVGAEGILRAEGRE